MPRIEPLTVEQLAARGVDTAPFLANFADRLAPFSIWMSLCAPLGRQPPDPLRLLIALHRADPRPDTIEVWVGVYHDEKGSTPVMRAVTSSCAMLTPRSNSLSPLKR